MKCKDFELQHIEDVEYRGHEIVIAQCKNCNQFTVDARSDNFDGEFLGGFIDTSIYTAIDNARSVIDKHCIELVLTTDIPF